MTDLTYRFGPAPDLGQFKRCDRCGEYDFSGRHRCGPSFKCVLAEAYSPGEDWVTIYARDAEQAAERYCAHYDNTNGEMYYGARDVLVRDGAGLVLAYTVDSAMVPEYSAHKPEHDVPLPDPEPEDNEGEVEDDDASS